jgi:hypothetical protein
MKFPFKEFNISEKSVIIKLFKQKYTLFYMSKQSKIVKNNLKNIII